MREATMALRNAAGNFYVNDNPTGAVVGQQPFGGARGSGTNDKAGSKMNVARWVSPRAIKETFAPPTEWRYPLLGEEWGRDYRNNHASTGLDAMRMRRGRDA